MGDVGGLFIEQGVIPLGQGADKMVGPGGPSGPNQFFLTGVQAAVHDVVPDGSVEQPGVLEDHAKDLAQVVPPILPDVNSVHCHLSGSDIVKAEEQVDQGSLARPGGADDGHRLARPHVDVQILVEKFSLFVAKLNAAKLDLAPEFFELRSCGIIWDFFLFVQHLKYPLRRRHGGLEDVGDAGRLGYGLGKVPGILNHGLEVAQEQGPPGDQDAADGGDGHKAQVVEKVHGGHDDARDKLSFPPGVVQAVVYLFKLGLGLGLQAEGLDDLVPREHLFYVTVQFAQTLLLAGKKPAGALGDKAGEAKGGGQDQDHHQGQQGADDEHHYQHPHQGGDSRD